MARVVVGVYMVRYPLGGMLSWALQYLLGLQQAGHDVTVVEKAHYHDACFDPKRGTMTDDPSAGLSTVRDLLRRFDLEQRLGFIDVHGQTHGLSQAQVDQAFTEADLFIDCGTHGAWLHEAESADCTTVLIDGEPGYTQIRWQKLIDQDKPVPTYDHYFSNGMLLGTDRCSAPTCGRSWGHAFNPVWPALFDGAPPIDPGACITTVMNWKAHGEVVYQGQTFGQKDIMFRDYLDLPSLTGASLSVAVAGSAPIDQLKAHGWRVEHGHKVTADFDTYRRHIHGSLAEFSVCKHVFVALHTGWFSDRSAAYLASGRPVILQDTGFSKVLPCGEGLFAVTSLEQAAAAIEAVRSDPARHAKAARQIARDYLSADRVMSELVSQSLASR